MINTDNFKKLLVDKFGSIKSAADRLETTEQNIYRMIRTEKVSMKFLEKLSKAIRVSEPDILNQIKKGSTNLNFNSNSVTNTVNTSGTDRDKEYEDEIEKLRKELNETKDKLLKCNEELLQFYKKNI